MIDEPTQYQLAEYAQAVREVGKLKAERDLLRQKIDDLEEDARIADANNKVFVNLAKTLEKDHARLVGDKAALVALNDKMEAALTKVDGYVTHYDTDIMFADVMDDAAAHDFDFVVAECRAVLADAKLLKGGDK